MQVAWLGAFMGFVVLAVAIEGYRYRWQSFRTYARPTCVVISGPQAGRSGKIVSLAPFDLWVTLNVEADTATKENYRREKLAEVGEQHRAWVDESAGRLRDWITVPRWRVEWKPAKGHDVGGWIL